MQRFIAIEVSPNTLEEDASLEVVAMQKGIIRSLQVTFPSGCAALVYMQVFCHGEQIAPWNKTGALRGNDITFQAVKDYVLDQPPYEIIVKTWNLDDTYTHTPLVDIMEDEIIEKSVSELVLGLE